MHLFLSPVTTALRVAKPTACTWMAQKVDMSSGEHQGTFLSWLNISFALTDRYILENYEVPFFKKHTIYILYKQDRKRCLHGSWEGLQQGSTLKSNFRVPLRRKEQIPCKIPMLGLWWDLLDSVCLPPGKILSPENSASRDSCSRSLHRRKHELLVLLLSSTMQWYTLYRLSVIYTQISLDY